MARVIVIDDDPDVLRDVVNALKTVPCEARSAVPAPGSRARSPEHAALGAKIGVDQHARNPCARARSRYPCHSGSVAMWSPLPSTVLRNDRG